MRAAQLKKYDEKNIELELVEIEVPTVSDNDVLIKVSAAGVNPLDNMISRGDVKLVVP